VRGESGSYRLELAQRGAVAAVLLAFFGLLTLHLLRIHLGLFGSAWVAAGAAAGVTLIVLVSVWLRNRPKALLSALLLAGAAFTGIAADNVLLVAALAVALGSAGYLATQFVGFALPPCWHSRIDTAATNVALVLASVSSMFVLAEALLWMLSNMPGEPLSLGSVPGAAPVSEERVETPLPASRSTGATASVRVPTLAEADALLEPGVVAAAHRRADALAMAPEWARREVQVPGAHRAAYWHGALHVYNADRLRIIGQPPAKNPSWFRVLVLGDSLTYGEGIEEQFTYPRQLERLLRRHWRVEVVNAGIDGAQSEDILRTARRLIPQLQPDLVIYGVCLNDFLPSGAAEYDGLFHLPELIHARTRIGPVAELLVSNALLRLGLTSDFFDDILHGIPAFRDRFAHDVAELNRLARAHESSPVISLVLDQFPEPGGRGQQIASLAEAALGAAEMTVLSTDEYYRRFSALSPMRVSRWEGHPNEEANAIWALMLEQVVERDVRLTAYRSADMH